MVMLAVLMSCSYFLPLFQTSIKIYAFVLEYTANGFILFTLIVSFCIGLQEYYLYLKYVARFLLLNSTDTGGAVHCIAFHQVGSSYVVFYRVTLHCVPLYRIALYLVA